MPVFVFIISLVGLWWVLEAAAWKWSSRSFYDPCSKTRKGPGGPSNAWGVLGTGGCRMDVHIRWLLPARNGSFHFLDFFPKHPLDFPERRYWDVQLQKEKELLSGLCVTSLPFLYSLGKTREFSMECGPGMLFPSEWVWTCPVQLQNLQLLAWATL